MRQCVTSDQSLETYSETELNKKLQLHLRDRNIIFFIMILLLGFLGFVFSDAFFINIIMTTSLLPLVLDADKKVRTVRKELKRRA